MKSITGRIRFYFILVVMTMGLIMALGIGVVLPEYYVAYQLGVIEERTSGLTQLRDQGDNQGVIDQLILLQNEMGGELYTIEENGESRGLGRGRMSGSSNGNGDLHTNSQFVPTGDVTAYQYTNKLGIEIYAYGIEVSDEYLVYEVDIQSLDDATALMIQVAMMVIGVGFLLALLLSFALTNQITRPIRALNNLAHAMRKKEVAASYVVKNKDELYELNGAMNAMYEELKSNIYQLESELKKERNTEMLKKRFLAQATHELKTPLAVIGGYAELLGDKMYEDQQEQDHFIKSIYDETLVMNHIIMDILDYSKMETGNFDITPTEQEVGRWMQQLSSRLKSLADQKEIELRLKIPETTLVRSFDGNRMEQVVNNLVSNGVEHATTYVEVQMTYHEEGVHIRVHNDGLPIDEQDLAYLFDSFYKAKGKQSGTGLGLAIVKSIVQLHGGDYRVENEGDGVSFTIII